MRFKIILSVRPEAFGSVLPISYQFELAACVNRMITEDASLYENWLKANDLNPQDNLQQKLYAVSNLYIPKIQVDFDRLNIVVPRVQFWISFLPTVGTEEFVNQVFNQHNMLLGDKKSKVLFRVDDVNNVSPITYSKTMEYTTLSPVVVVGLRPNNTMEYLMPENPVFGQFLFDELLERYERLYKKTFEGSREFNFELLSPTKRKGVFVRHFSPQEIKIIGYMFKFRMTMDPALQQFAYEVGVGDKINFGFGYLELLNKEAN